MMWREAVMAQFDVLSCQMRAELVEETEKVRIVSTWLRFKEETLQVEFISFNHLHHVTSL
jgi:hypothetical protein